MSNATSISLSRCAIYAAPYAVTTWLVAPLGIVQGIYAKYYGLSLTVIAAVVFLGRVFDAVTDPLIGHWSDRYYERTGTRKPFIFAGGILLLVTGYFLYSPPADVGALYFACWMLAFYFAFTLLLIPHMAWAGELAPASGDKTKIYSVYRAAGYIGALCFYTIPLLPLFNTREITPQTLHVSVIAAGMMMLPLLFLCLKKTPNRGWTGRRTPGSAAPASRTPSLYQRISVFIRDWRGLFANKPFLLFVLAFLASEMGGGMWYGLVFIYVDVYLGMGGQFASMFLIAFAIGTLVIPIWFKAAQRFGKRACWLAGNSLMLICFLYTGTLQPGETVFSQLLVLKIVNTLGYACAGVMAPAMLSEICDYGLLKFRVERSASYFAAYIFATKAAQAIAIALGLAVAGWFGFDAAAATQSASGTRGLMLAMVWLPLLFGGLSLFFIWRSPIDERRHGVIQRRLQRRTGLASSQQITEPVHAGLTDASHDTPNIAKETSPT